MIGKLTIIALLFSMMTCPKLQGQITNEKTEKYNQLVEELGYEKTKKGLRLREKFYPKKEEEKKEVNLKSAGIIFQIFAYGLVIGLAVFILYLIFSNIQVDKKVETEVNIHEDLEDIEEVDADAGYKAAIDAGDYRLAIRMQFIKCLQKLSAAELIEWENEKTNRHYYRELKDPEVKQNFRQIANIFERCWYADVTLDVTEFRRYDQTFLTFLNLVR